MHTLTHTPIHPPIHSQHTQRGASGNQQANPNDEHVTESVSIMGDGPGPRAGHSATMLDRRLVIFGGSHGSKYLGDMYVLDTDPVPEPLVNAPSCLQLVCSDLRQYVDREDFSDVTLFVEGKAVLAHRLVLSMASDRYVLCVCVCVSVFECV